MPAPPCESQFPPAFLAHSLIQLHVRWWHTLRLPSKLTLLASLISRHPSSLKAGSASRHQHLLTFVDLLPSLDSAGVCLWAESTLSRTLETPWETHT